ncbi:lymphocyte antigen 6E-like [Pelobates fuscus]|uniref:lymphocyte antigen 6E-like n=1 Tax=Pelobates fuscus TaxID=191477 RepID=UPI002FE4CE3E
MDTIKIIVVLTTLCIGTAMSLQCYTCTGQTSNANCITTTTNCTTGQTYCMTTSASAGVGGVSFASITKTCAAACTAVSAGSSSLVSGSVSCCNTDLCNTSGATSIKSGVTILALTAGLILALLKNSL